MSDVSEEVAEEVYSDPEAAAEEALSQTVSDEYAADFEGTDPARPTSRCAARLCMVSVHRFAVLNADILNCSFQRVPFQNLAIIHLTPSTHMQPYEPVPIFEEERER